MPDAASPDVRGKAGMPAPGAEYRPENAHGMPAAGVGPLSYGQTVAFTTLMLFHVFNVFNARSDERSAFAGLFRNRWLLASVGISVGLQVLVVYAPFLQRAFGTVALGASDWLRCVAVASSVLWVRELTKLFARAMQQRTTSGMAADG